MRLFLAIELPDDVRRHLVGWRDDLKSQLRHASFTRDENLHITLKFLGEVDEKRTEPLVESLKKITSGGAIQLHADKMECFPNRGPVRIVAAGFGGSIDALAGIHRSIEQRCQHLGFERETRQYRPHVTLARARPTLPASVRELVESTAQQHLPGPVFNVNAFALIESRLRPQGAEYHMIKIFDLGLKPP